MIYAQLCITFAAPRRVLHAPEISMPRCSHGVKCPPAAVCPFCEFFPRDRSHMLVLTDYISYKMVITFLEGFVCSNLNFKERIIPDSNTWWRIQQKLGMGDIGAEEKIYTFDQLIRQRAVDIDQTPLFAYPKSQLGVSDYEFITGKDLNRLVDGAAKAFVEAGIQPVVSRGYMYYYSQYRSSHV